MAISWSDESVHRLAATFPWQSWSAPWAVIGAAFLVYAPVRQAVGIDFSVCLFSMIVGDECPLCGLTRAFSLILRGELGLAGAAHVAAIPIFSLWIATTVIAVTWLTVEWRAAQLNYLSLEKRYDADPPRVARRRVTGR